MTERDVPVMSSVTCAATRYRPGPGDRGRHFAGTDGLKVLRTTEEGGRVGSPGALDVLLDALTPQSAIDLPPDQ
ncbi:hypothetical protein D3C74_441200 [compost metagenome]